MLWRRGTLKRTGVTKPLFAPRELLIAALPARPTWQGL